MDTYKGGVFRIGLSGLDFHPSVIPGPFSRDIRHTVREAAKKKVYPSLMARPLPPSPPLLVARPLVDELFFAASLREDIKKSVFLVTGPLRFYPPYTNGFSGPCH